MSILRPQRLVKCMCTTRILDGWRISEKVTEKVIRNEQKLIEQTALRLRHIKEETGCVPGLAVIRFGYNAEAERFIEKKKELALRCGIDLRDFKFDTSCTTEQVQEKIHQLNNNKSSHGIVVKCPLPRHIDEEAILSSIAPIKDVDGCCNTNEGRLLKLGDTKRRAEQRGIHDDIHYFNMVNLPTTALATLCFVESYKLPLEKKKATIIGRSDTVGLPIALLLTHKDVTCQLSHNHKDVTPSLLKDVSFEYDYLIFSLIMLFLLKVL